MDNLKPLNPTDTSNDRDLFKAESEKLRESGNLEDSLSGFQQVLNWDESNGNLHGQLDVMGHLAVTYLHMVEFEADDTKRRELIDKALEVTGQGIALAEDKLPDDVGPCAILHSHLASGLLAYDEFAVDHRQVREQAFNAAEFAYDNLPGSDAHKSWILNKMAWLTYLLGDKTGAMDYLSKAETAIISETVEEEMKLKVWLTGIWLTHAKFAMNEKALIIARAYAAAVDSMDDSKHYLVNRKSEAQKLLSQIKGTGE